MIAGAPIGVRCQFAGAPEPRRSATFVYPSSGDFLAVPIKSAYALGFMANVTEILIITPSPKVTRTPWRPP